MRVTRFWNTLHQVRAKSEDWKANNAKVFDSKKTKGPTQDSQNRLSDGHIFQFYQHNDHASN
jgi:hypothetical protein